MLIKAFTGSGATAGKAETNDESKDLSAEKGPECNNAVCQNYRDALIVFTSSISKKAKGPQMEQIDHLKWPAWKALPKKVPRLEQV